MSGLYTTNPLVLHTKKSLLRLWKMEKKGGLFNTKLIGWSFFFGGGGSCNKMFSFYFPKKIKTFFFCFWTLIMIPWSVFWRPFLTIWTWPHFFSLSLFHLPTNQLHFETGYNAFFFFSWSSFPSKVILTQFAISVFFYFWCTNLISYYVLLQT